MIQPIATANQIIANKTKLPVRGLRNNENGPMQPVTIPNETCPEGTTCGEKLNINFTGCREYSLNGNKINYFA